MKKLLFLFILFMALPFSGKSDERSRIVLLGGSSVATTYLPKDLSQTATLQRAVDAHYGAGRAEVLNWADNGEFIARFLITGKYEQFRKAVPGVDVFLVRFGTNDAKRMRPAEFRQQLETFLDLLKQDFPSARFILEDGIYLDYPAHYTSDRNKKLQPYWEQTRALAQQRGYPLSALFERSKEETKKGNWDLRIRRQINKVIVYDNSRDEEHAGDVTWFTDIHPNPAGVQVAVDAEMEALKSLFPDTLPNGGKKHEREAMGEDNYIGLLNFAPERLTKTLLDNPDTFQTPSP